MDPKTTGFAEFNQNVKTLQKKKKNPENNQSDNVSRNTLALAELYEDEVK